MEVIFRKHTTLEAIKREFFRLEQVQLFIDTAFRHPNIFSQYTTKFWSGELVFFDGAIL